MEIFRIPYIAWTTRLHKFFKYTRYRPWWGGTIAGCVWRRRWWWWWNCHGRFRPEWLAAVGLTVMYRAFVPDSVPCEEAQLRPRWFVCHNESRCTRISLQIWTPLRAAPRQRRSMIAAWCRNNACRNRTLVASLVRPAGLADTMCMQLW